MVIVKNPNHPLYNLRGKVQDASLFSGLQEGEVPVLINDELLIFNENDLSSTGSKKKLRLPNSRKEFYTFIQNEKTKKVDIIELVELMSQSKCPEKNVPLISFKKSEHEQDLSYSKECLISFIKDSNKNEIVEEIRTRRDSGLIEFNLPNNNISAGVVYETKLDKLHKPYKRVFKKNKSKKNF